MLQPRTSAKPPYVSFKTFLIFLEWLNEEGISLPSRIDRSFWGRRLLGSSGIQLIGGLRFLGLIDDDNKPQPILEEMVGDKKLTREKRKSILRECLLLSYADALTGLDLERITEAQLRESFSTYSLTGETLRKALAFFIHAALYCNIPLSPYITRKKRREKTTAVAGTSSSFSGTRKRAWNRVPSVRTSSQLIGWNDLQPILQGLLVDLVQSGHNWTKEARDGWVRTFMSFVEYTYQGS